MTLIVIRTGSNPVKLVMTTALWKIKLPNMLKAQTALPSKSPLNPGFGPRTMPRSATPRALSVRRSLSQPGPRMYRTGSGKMLLKWELVYSMPVVTPKSPRMTLHRRVVRRHWHALAHRIRCWVNARLKSVCMRLFYTIQS
jgi:hypothetical protein